MIISLHPPTRVKCGLAIGIAGLLVLGLVSPVSASPEISEFMAINNRTLDDEDGSSSDWIEIRNTNGSATIDIGGYYLTDDPAALTKWQFPGRSIPGGGFLVVFASAKNRAPVGAGELHTNFSLNGNGEYLALVDPDGQTVVTEFNTYPEQFEDVSFGISAVVETQTVLASGVPCRHHVPAGPVVGWEQPIFNDAAWTFGFTGVGYDTGDFYESLIGGGSDVQAAMFNGNTSVFIRVPFNVATTGNLVGGRLRMKYDDGFVAWLNGTRSASAQAPVPLLWNSISTAEHIDADAIEFEDFSINDQLSALVPGLNTLAIHGLNRATDSSDLIMMPEIELDYIDPEAPTEEGYMTMPSPGAANTDAVEGFVADTEFTMDRGFYDAPIQVNITSATPDAEIRYTTNGSDPTPTNGILHNGNPITISTTTVLRAAAFKDGFEPTNVDTQTYIFASAVKTQPANPPLYPSTWGTDFGAPVQADYQMDPAIVTSPAYAGEIEDAISNTLPALCISTNIDNLFAPTAIYADGRNGSSEIPISLEYFDPHSTDEFQLNAGMRLHGGNARSHPKKPFRLYFRRAYSEGELDFPLFEGSPVDSFDQLILRPGGHDGWAVPFGNAANDLATHASYVRDQFIRKTEVEMGLLSPRGKYVHVFINGLYWGVYDLHERANDDFFASHLGGNPEDYDVLHHPSLVGQDFTVVDGVATRYQSLLTLAASGIDSPQAYADIQEFLDIDGYIDAMISRIWVQDYDWLSPIYMQNPNGVGPEEEIGWFDNKNWYCGALSRNGTGTFHFFSWDAEMSMGANLLTNPTLSEGVANPTWLGNPPPQRVENMDTTRVGSDPGGPGSPYNALRQYPEFQLRFGDRLHKHLFNDGMLSTAANRARLEAMEMELDSAMVAESARWGDVNEGSPRAGIAFNRNSDWRGEISWLKNTFIANRNDYLIERFRAINLYPDIDAPTFSIHGGPVPVGTDVTLVAPVGTIYYTTDGSDPVIPGLTQQIELVSDDAAARALIPSVGNGGALLGDTWKGLIEPFNDTGWLAGTQGVGYDYDPFVDIDVGAMVDTNGSVFIRVPFTVADQSVIDSLADMTLSMRYDDGFVAYLNGVEIARRNVDPGVPAWNALASANHGDTLAVVYDNIDVSIWTVLLRPGNNVLAFQALNAALDSSDLLLQARLSGSGVSMPATPSPTAMVAAGPITLDATTTIRARVLGPGGDVSALTEAQFLVGTLASRDNLVVSELLYRPREPRAIAETAISTNRDAYEFVEVMNVSNEPVDMTNVRFTQGVTFGFPGGILPPGGKQLVVRSRDAFLARYGAGMAPEIAGEFENETGLSNGGERVTLTDSQNRTIHSFRYRDEAPWPTAPDENDRSLVLVDPTSIPDHELPASWTASMDAGGTPGSFQITSYSQWRGIYFDPTDPLFFINSLPIVDFDGDGCLNILEYALGTDPALEEIGVGKRPPDVTVALDNRLIIVFAQRAQNPDFVCTVETALGLASWTGDVTEIGSGIPNADGSVTRAFQANTTVDADDQRHMRVRATQVEP